jgi:hypothetical protein
MKYIHLYPPEDSINKNEIIRNINESYKTRLFIGAAIIYAWVLCYNGN